MTLDYPILLRQKSNRNSSLRSQRHYHTERTSFVLAHNRYNLPLRYTGYKAEANATFSHAKSLFCDMKLRGTSILCLSKWKRRAEDFFHARRDGYAHKNRRFDSRRSGVPEGADAVSALYAKRARITFAPDAHISKYVAVERRRGGVFTRRLLNNLSLFLFFP